MASVPRLFTLIAISWGIEPSDGNTSQPRPKSVSLCKYQLYSGVRRKGRIQDNITMRVSPQPQLPSTSTGKASAFAHRATARQVGPATADKGSGQNTGEQGWIVGQRGRKGNAVFARRILRRRGKGGINPARSFTHQIAGPVPHQWRPDCLLARVRAPFRSWRCPLPQAQ